MPRKQPLLTQLEREELKSILGDESTLIRLTSFTQKEKDLIEDYWDDILRLASSIRQGSVIRVSNLAQARKLPEAKLSSTRAKGVWAA